MSFLDQGYFNKEAVVSIEFRSLLYSAIEIAGGSKRLIIEDIVMEMVSYAAYIGFYIRLSSTTLFYEEVINSLSEFIYEEYPQGLDIFIDGIGYVLSSKLTPVSEEIFLQNYGDKKSAKALYVRMLNDTFLRDTMENSPTLLSEIINLGDVNGFINTHVINNVFISFFQLVINELEKTLGLSVNKYFITDEIVFSKDRRNLLIKVKV